MKKTIFTLTTIVAFMYGAIAQKCTLFEQGKAYKSTGKGWFCMKPLEPGWAKMKAGDKAKFIEEYNKNVESGSEKPSYEGQYDVTVKNVNLENNNELVTVSMLISGVEYSFNLICLNDTMFFFRGPRMTFTVANGDTTGISIIGVQAIPNKLKVGDVLPIYEDYGIAYPKIKEWQTKRTELAGYERKTEKGCGHFLDSRDLTYKNGEYIKTYSKAIYEDVTVNVKEKSQFMMLTKNYVNATVAGEEDIILSGKTYKANIIESQKWVKSGMETAIDSDNKAWQKNYENHLKKIQKKSNKEVMKLGLTNEYGYLVTYTTEWFVPGIGIVKSISYDLNGFITAKSSIDSF